MRNDAKPEGNSNFLDDYTKVALGVLKEKREKGGRQQYKEVYESTATRWLGRIALVLDGIAIFISFIQPEFAPLEIAGEATEGASLLTRIGRFGKRIVAFFARDPERAAHVMSLSANVLWCTVFTEDALSHSKKDKEFWLDFVFAAFSGGALLGDIVKLMRASEKAIIDAKEVGKFVKGEVTKTELREATKNTGTYGEVILKLLGNKEVAKQTVIIETLETIAEKKIGKSLSELNDKEWEQLKEIVKHLSEKDVEELMKETINRITNRITKNVKVIDTEKLKNDLQKGIKGEDISKFLKEEFPRIAKFLKAYKNGFKVVWVRNLRDSIKMMMEYKDPILLGKAARGGYFYLVPVGKKELVTSPAKARREIEGHSQEWNFMIQCAEKPNSTSEQFIYDNLYNNKNVSASQRKALFAATLALRVVLSQGYEKINRKEFSDLVRRIYSKLPDNITAKQFIYLLKSKDISELEQWMDDLVKKQEQQKLVQ